MDFYEVVRQAVKLLQGQGRLTYRTLKRQFDLDDDALEDLKDELLFSHPVADKADRGLVWTGAPVLPDADVRHRPEAEMRLYTVLRAVTAVLRQEKRVTYRELKHAFGIDDAFLDDLREELLLKRFAVDEEGKVLVWTGEVQPGATSTPLPASPEASPPPIAPTSAPEPTRPSPEAERRQLTVMFCDLADSTKLSQRLDPEDLREVVRAYQKSAADVIRQFEGHMAQYLGDGLLIYFGWPVAHEDDAQRAAHAGLGIVEAITTTLNPRLQQEKGVQLTVRLGVHTGPVVVGEMGGGGRHENLATGETVNIAARLEGLAAPNTVVMSSVTARLVERAFVLEGLGPHVLKGVAEPMQVFRVLGSLERHEDETATVGAPFLVGRDEEIGLLLRRWEQSKEGLGQVVFISGEAGIGKSSLVATVRHHVVQDGYTRMTFRCSPYHTNSALYPVITHLEQILGFERDDTSGTKLSKLEQALNTTSLSLEESVPLLATLLSVPLGDRYPAPTLSPQQQRQQTLDTLVAWLMEEAERQAVLGVWEDMHWADPSTLEMLGLVLDQTPTVPMLNVLTFRPEFESPWPTRSHMTPITLNRLERPQVEALITHMADDKPLPAEVVEHIVSKTDGVPLYVEELTKMLLVSELLYEEAGQYVLTGPLTTVAIPDTLQDSLMARLDQMNMAKEVAQLGAVLGREFDYELIQAISSQEQDTLQKGLAQLVEAELLYQRGRPPRAKYIFKHALIQDAAYASLLKSNRQQYHQRIVHVLEAQFPEIADNQPELLAHHYTEAGLNEQAVVYWQRAGKQSIQYSAYVEAINHLTKGLEVLKAHPDMPTCIQQELGLQIMLGQALIVTKGQAAPEVGHAYNRAQELCQRVEDALQRFQVLHGLWHFHAVRAEVQTVRELSEELLTLAQDIQEPSYHLCAHWALGGACFLQGSFATASEQWKQSIDLYNPQYHHTSTFLFGFDFGVFSLCWSPHALWHLGYPDQAVAMSHKALDLAHELSHPFSLAVALAYAIMFRQFCRDRDTVDAYANEVMALCAEQGFTYYLAWGTIFRGWSLSEQGQVEEGVSLMRRGLADLRATGGEVRLPYYLALMAESCEKANRVAEGLTLLAEALSLVDKNDERWYEAELHRLKGELLLSQSPDNHTEAETCFQQALSIARRQHAKSLELRAATSLARLWQSQGKRQDAYDLLAPVYNWFTEGFDTADLKEAKALFDELA